MFIACCAVRVTTAPWSEDNAFCHVQSGGEMSLSKTKPRCWMAVLLSGYKGRINLFPLSGPESPLSEPAGATVSLSQETILCSGFPV